MIYVLVSCLTIPENDPVVAVQSLFLKVTTLNRDNTRFDLELSTTSENYFSGSGSLIFVWLFQIIEIHF